MICSGRVKAEDIRPEQKWEFISLNDFHSTSYFKPFAYAYLWASLVISVAVYCVDTFTAVNLLAFDRWSSEIKPFIPLNISKWIFSTCIIASWVNLAFEYVRAIRVMRRGVVAESYLDSLAVRLQSARFGNGRGWRRFLVFAELTKSKKGAEYVALFTYFSFQTWIRIIFCQGPRQVINALTLYSVLKLQYDSNQENVEMVILTFFKNIGVLADKDQHQVLILSGMVFTFVIWGFGALSLLLAILFYLLFLWHYIPNADGGLSGYCERKINARLAQIVSLKVNKAIEEEERKRLKADAKALAKGEKTQLRQATLPNIVDPLIDENVSGMSIIDRQNTNSPTISNRAPTPIDYETSSILGIDRPSSRATTLSSATSYGPNTPFLNKAADMGYYYTSESPSPSISSEFRGSPAPFRPVTPSSSSNFSPNGPSTRQPTRGIITTDQRSFSNSSPLAPTMSPGPYSSSRPPNAPFAPYASSSYHQLAGNPFDDNSMPQISRRGTSNQSQRPPAAISNVRPQVAQNIHRLASPAPYLNGRIQSPGFNNNLGPPRNNDQMR